MSRTENNIVLLSITLCWSASYIFIKNLPLSLSTYAYLTLTTGIAAVILVAVFQKHLKKIDKATMIKGFLLSILLTGNLLAEKLGLHSLSSANASFISALTILFVPVLLMTLRVKISRNNSLGAVIILFGIWQTTGFSTTAFFNTGSGYMVIACLCTAFYTLAVDKFAKEESPLLLGITQMCFSALISFVLWFIETPSTFLSLDYTNEMLSSIFILAFFTKAYAYIALMFSQRYATPISVTVIASTEPVVTLVLAVLIPATYVQQETFTATGLMGALVITVGAVVAGTSFLEQKKERQRS